MLRDMARARVCLSACGAWHSKARGGYEESRRGGSITAIESIGGHAEPRIFSVGMIQGNSRSCEIGVSNKQGGTFFFFPAFPLD